MGITKHELIIDYIKELSVGTKVSVRQIAKDLDVSDGTAYRAIKEAERLGFVSSIPKVGTVRIETIAKKEITDLTLEEVVSIVEGEVIVGRESLQKTFETFAIGASSLGALSHYVDEQTLFIVGDRQQLQLEAVKLGASLLIVEGFDVSAEVKEAALAKQITIISTPYDAFAVATMINRDLNARLAEREIVLVKDIMVTNVFYLREHDRVQDWHKLATESGHSHFPVVDAKDEVVGMVSALEVAGRDWQEPISTVMSPSIAVSGDSSVSHAARVMTWEGLELVPVVQKGKMVGIVGRQDIINAFQHIQKQPHVAETLDNIVLSGFTLKDIPEGIEMEGLITEFMTNEFGSASCGVMVTLMNSAAYIAVRKKYKLDLVTENFSLQYLRYVQFDNSVRIEAKILLLEKKAVKIEISTYGENNEILAKALMSGRILEKKPRIYA